VAISQIELSNNLGSLIPETQSNIAYALPDARELDDIAAVRGRIVRIGNFAKSASSIIDFGASNHVASAILGYMTFNRLVRSAMNIKYDKRIKKIGQSVFRVSNYDRRREPRQIAVREGMSVCWGIKQALEKNPEAEMIYHEGALRKEPMCIIFGSSPLEVVEKVRLILGKYLEWKSLSRQGHTSRFYSDLVC
jgi:hydroxymethylpyrimidine/phosphomethylpyrimidine kinase